MLNKTNLSHYELIVQMLEKFTQWSPAIFIGYNSINLLPKKIVSLLINKQVENDLVLITKECLSFLNFQKIILSNFFILQLLIPLIKNF